jgi:ribosome-binding factor A
VLAALERNKRFLRGEIARHVNLKFAPDIRFRIDERFDEAERIEKLCEHPRSSATWIARRTMTVDADQRREDIRPGCSANAKSATCTAGSCSTNPSA